MCARGKEVLIGYSLAGDCKEEGRCSDGIIVSCLSLLRHRFMFSYLRYGKLQLKHTRGHDCKLTPND